MFISHDTFQEVWGYKQEDIVILTDDAQNPRQIPTRDNIVSLSFACAGRHLIVIVKIQAMQWLVRGAQPHDSLFFHCKYGCCILKDTLPYLFHKDSGHGGQTKDLDGDEADGYDEVIYPVDYEQAGHLVDDVSILSSRAALVAKLTECNSSCTILWSSPFHPDVVSPRSLM